VGGVTDRG
jgi:hypothetical protein